MKDSTSGFDYLRLVLALSVLAWHTIPLTQGETIATSLMAGWPGVLVRLIMPMFFALSGFLVAASLERNALSTFIVFRALRIGPALAVEITLSALILGPFFTMYSVSDYFADPLLARYFLNIIGLIHYQLPGLFTENPFPNIVNGSLWSVPFELECYIALVFLSLVRLTAKPALLLGVIAIGTGLIIAFPWLRPQSAPKIDAAVPGRILIFCFLAGVMFYAARSTVIYSAFLGIMTFVVTLICLSVPSLYAFCPIPAAYATIWIGLQRPRKAPLIFSGDYSYGIYLYAFPIQQTTVMLFPSLGLFSTLVISLSGVVLFAAFSWHIIEKPSLKLKKRFYFVPKPKMA